MLCSMADRNDLCELLLDFKADPQKKGPRGLSAMVWADWYHSSKALALLKAERRERREDREGLKRLQQALKEGLHALFAPFFFFFFFFSHVLDGFRGIFYVFLHFLHLFRDLIGRVGGTHRDALGCGGPHRGHELPRPPGREV